MEIFQNNNHNIFMTSGDAWRWAIAYIDRNGMDVLTEDHQLTREVMNLVMAVTSPADGWPIKGSGWDIPALEVYVRDQILGGENRTGFSYTYGERIQPRLAGLIEHLRAEPNTRRAVVSIYGSDDYENVHPPCWMSLEFLRRGKLHLTAFIRSNDMKAAWPANIYGLNKLLEHVSREIGAEPGSITTMSVSAHYYYK